jgi:hypothetical protein
MRRRQLRVCSGTVTTDLLMLVHRLEADPTSFHFSRLLSSPQPCGSMRRRCSRASVIAMAIRYFLGRNMRLDAAIGGSASVGSICRKGSDLPRDWFAWILPSHPLEVCFQKPRVKIPKSLSVFERSRTAFPRALLFLILFLPWLPTWLWLYVPAAFLQFERLRSRSSLRCGPLALWV